MLEAEAIARPKSVDPAGDFPKMFEPMVNADRELGLVPPDCCFRALECIEFRPSMSILMKSTLRRFSRAASASIESVVTEPLPSFAGVRRVFGPLPVTSSERPGVDQIG